jgi:hypothetical protein
MEEFRATAARIEGEMRELFPSYSCQIDADGGIRDFVGGIPLFGSGTPSIPASPPLSLSLTTLPLCLRDTLSIL